MTCSASIAKENNNNSGFRLRETSKYAIEPTRKNAA